MIGDTLPEYVFIRISIFCLRLIAPLSIVYALASWYKGIFIYSEWLGLYALAEASFYLLVYLPRSWWLQQAATHPPPLSRADREALFAKCFTRIANTNLATGWFLNPSSISIGREDMKEWLLWALFGSRADGCKREWAEELDEYLTRIENYTGHKLQQGRSDGVKSMRTTLDPVVTVHRPLVWYMIVATVDTITCARLLWAGFQHFDSRNPFLCFPPRWISLLSQRSPHRDLVYWYRPHRSKTKAPVLFLHGIGIGLWTYFPFLLDIMAADPDVGILALENLTVSMHISKPPLYRAEMLSALTCLLDHHNISSFVLAAHSYGTVLAAHILRDPSLSQRITSTLLVDPVPFLLYLPAVAYNFVYRQPRTANEWQLWYFASRDPDIARTLARYFFWVENVLWKEDLERKDYAVVLCGKDQIVDSREVRRYLTGSDDITFRWRQDGLEVLFYPDLDHSQQFDTAKTRRPIVQIVSRFVRQSGGSH